MPSFLFFLNRYMSVLCHIPVIVEFFGVIPESVSPIRLMTLVALPNANDLRRAAVRPLLTPLIFIDETEYMRCTRCREFQQYHRFISMVIQGVVAALMLLRTYALYGQDRRVLILLSTIIGTGGIISVVCLI